MSNRQRKAAWIFVASLVAVSLGVHADCVRSTHFGALPTTLASQELRHEIAVSTADPALDGTFARYADLHRDAVGYTMVQAAPTSMVAHANPEPRRPLMTR